MTCVETQSPRSLANPQNQAHKDTHHWSGKALGKTDGRGPLWMKEAMGAGCPAAPPGPCESPRSSWMPHHRMLAQDLGATPLEGKQKVQGLV